MQDTRCVCTWQSVAMVTAYFCENLAEWTTSTILKRLESNLVDIITLRYRCGRNVFCVCQTKRCHGNHTFLCQNEAFKLLRSNFVCMMIYRCRCAKYPLCLYRTMRCHGNHIFFKKSCRANLFHNFETIEKKFGKYDDIEVQMYSMCILCLSD